MQVYLYAPDAELISRWQRSLPGAVRCSDSLSAVDPHDNDAVLIVHWGKLSPDQQEQLLARHDGSALVALVDHPTATEGERLLSHGVDGYANTYIQPELLPEVVSTVSRGDIWTGPELMQSLLKRLLARQAPALDPALQWQLSSREQQVLDLLIQGLSNKQIARQLAITERTVKAHVSAILEKSGVRDRIELILILSGQAPSSSQQAGAGT